MEESQKEGEELSEEEELRELDLAATQALEFLGQSYVSLSGFHAVEEFLCEQYAASTRFFVRCLSGSSSFSNTALSCEPLTSRKNPAQCTAGESIPETLKISVQGSSGSTDLQTDQITVPQGGLDSDDGRTLKAIESLCMSIDSILVKARKVREKSTTTGTKASKPSGKSGASIVTASEDARAATAKNANSKTCLVANARERTKKSVPREIINGHRKAANSGRPSPRTVQASKGIRKMSESMKECQPPETCSNRAEGSNIKLPDESASTGKKTRARSRLKLPEKLCSLLSWFKTRGISMDDPLNIPRAEAQAAKEDFLSVLNEVNKQQDYLDHKDSTEVAARVEETQGVLKELASHVSPFEMGLLLWVAPAGATEAWTRLYVPKVLRDGKSLILASRQPTLGSTIAKQRDFGIQKVLRTQSQQGASAPSLAKCQVTYSGALTPLHSQLRTFSWLPQNCWPYFGQAMESLRCGSNKEFDTAQMLKRTYTSYTDLEHVLGMARLWHVIQVTLFQSHLEDVVAAPLLPNLSPRSELSLVKLFRCRLAHSILCREGRGLMVMAERLVTPY